MEYSTLESYGNLLKALHMVKDIDLLGKGSKIVNGLTYDSRDAAPGTLFICKGAAFKKEYLEDALASGALAYISEERYELQVDVPYILVKDIRTVMSTIADKFFNSVWKSLKITAFGGTKGKSTSTYYMKAIVDDYMNDVGGEESAVLSTIDDYDGIELVEAHNTTPEAVELHRHMYNAVNSGITFMEMEVSSQALKYHRVDDLRFDVGVFLNISEDHISPVEHKDFEDYISSKMKMFELTDHAVINLDSDHIRRVLDAAEASEDIHTFSVKNDNADYYAYDVRRNGGETIFNIRCAGFDEEFKLTMPGTFNVSNAVAAAAAADILGIPSEYIKSGLYRAKARGRMELFTSTDGIVTAIVDYAHNKLSFGTLFESIKEEYPEHDIVAVFGSSGDKANVRRKELGEIAGKYSEKAYLVPDDPGKSSAYLVSKEIAEHLNCPYEIMDTRGEGIQKAIMECVRPTIVLILGKSNEKYQKYGDEFVPCLSDIEYTERYMHEYEEHH